MTSSEQKRLFLAVIDLESEAERTAFLDHACQDNPSLRIAVEDLLVAHEQQCKILDLPVQNVVGLQTHVEDAITVLKARSDQDSNSISDRIGEFVGSYRLLEKIGEGAFGEVFVAQQEQPIRRRVAIKLLKPGMNTKEVLARFEAERQALGMMNHPNISHIFDAGTTATGQPFFAMELVRGVPITEFCERQQLGMRQRIELFNDVCQAVQHAHQKGIIHRDLKPSNVMVTLIDAKPIAKVIDFGVAKAILEPLTNRTLYTRFMHLIGTPMYMSPEQAEMTAQDVDTRSDVFSLGMMLYELLTGSPPYDEQRMNTAPFDELRRIIREEELPRPSYRLTTLGKQQSTISAQRRVTSTQLMVELRGDLDWIVMKAIEKDRSRRYETASHLAQDLHRYLSGEPIEARPPSSWYRFSKFAHRHRVTLTAGSLVLLAMMIGTGVSLWQAAWAISERDAKEVARDEAVRARREVEGFSQRLRQANLLLTSGRAHADADRWPEAAADYSLATEAQPLDYHVWVERGAFYTRLGLWKAAADDFTQALSLEAPVSGAEWWGVPQLLLFVDRADAYRDLCQKMIGEASGRNDSSFEWAMRCSLIGKQPPFEPDRLSLLTRQLNERLKNSSAFGPPDGPGFEPPGEKRKFDRDDQFENNMHKKPGHRPREHPPNGGNHFHKRAGSMPKGVQLYVMGLARYREGDYKQAIETLQSAMASDLGWQHREICYPALALAYSQVGRHEDAREAFEKSRELTDGWAATMAESGVGTTPFPWFDFLECLLLQQEATELITGKPVKPDSRWRTLQDKAWAAIR